MGWPESEKTAGFIVDRDQDGISVGRDVPKMGLQASSTAMIRFKDVRVPAANRLGSKTARISPRERVHRKIMQNDPVRSRREP